MDGCSGKRNRSGIVVPRKDCNLVLKDKVDTEGQNAQFCNRIGCSGRLKYRKSSPFDCAEKPKNSRASIHSSNGKEIVGSSSRSCFPTTTAKISPQDSPRKFSSQLKPHSLKSGDQGESQVTKLLSSRDRNHQTQLQPKMRAVSARKVTSNEIGSSSVGSKDTSKKVPRRRPPSSCENVLTGSSTDSNCSISISAEPSVTVGSTSRNHSSGNRYGLRNLKCNSISDIIPQGGSSLESKNRRDVLKKRIPEGESSSSSKVKKGSLAQSKDEHISPSINGISMSSSRRNRNWGATHDSINSSVMTRRSVNGNSRIARSNRGSTTALSVPEVQGITPRIPRHEMHGNDYYTSPSLSSMGDSSNASSSYTPEQTGGNVPGLATFSFRENGVTQGLRRHHLSGAAEVLFALERIEQDEELTYEQLLVLENNLFFGNLYFYDQHRDMRLDIDNMSYEELLALGDQMGTVSTALSAETFAKCVKRTIYQSSSLEVGCGGCREDEVDIKCSICQEEYAIGDEIGKLGCEHGYHVGCLQQWLRLKNWCPICKVSAAP